MRILLDQNTPLGVGRILTTHDVRTAFQMGWATLSNGDLLDAAEQAGFEALVTSDQNEISPSSSFSPITGRQYARSRRGCGTRWRMPLRGPSP
jgi:hypothetical protein